MSVTIPLRTDLEDYDLSIALDGVVYTLRFLWNRRDSAWYMDVGDEDGVPILNSIKVVVDFPIGARCRDERWPPGLFLAVDTSTLRADAGLHELGDRVQLLYFERAELPVNPLVLPV